MNSTDRQTLASSVAVILYLLLVYGLIGELDCSSEQQAAGAHPPVPSRLLCEATSDQATPDGHVPAAIRLVSQNASQTAFEVVLRCESFKP